MICSIILELCDFKQKPAQLTPVSPTCVMGTVQYALDHCVSLCHSGSFLTVKHVLINCPGLVDEHLTFFCLPSAELNIGGLLCDDSGLSSASSLFAVISVADFPVIYSR